MNELNEIINRYDNGVQIINQSEMEYVIEKYIYIRKGVEVKINLTKGFPPELMTIAPQFLTSELQKLESAYQDACIWLINNKDEWFD